MPPLDAGSLLGVVSDDSPTGPNLEFDPDFGALERAAQGKPEQQDRRHHHSGGGAGLERGRAAGQCAAGAHPRPAGAGPTGHCAPASYRSTGILRSRVDDTTVAGNALGRNPPAARPRGGQRSDAALQRVAAAGPSGVGAPANPHLPLARSARIGRSSWRDVGIATGTIREQRTETSRTRRRSVAPSWKADPAPARGAAHRGDRGRGMSATAIGATFDSHGRLRHRAGFRRVQQAAEGCRAHHRPVQAGGGCRAGDCRGRGGSGGRRAGGTQCRRGAGGAARRRRDRCQPDRGATRGRRDAAARPVHRLLPAL